MFLIYFMLIIFLTLIGYLCKVEKLVMVLGLLTFLTIPGIIVFDGYIAKYFFVYGDLCTAVNHAMYRQEFPVAGKAFGYYVNCLERETKLNLYIMSHKIYQFDQSPYRPPAPDPDEEETPEYTQYKYLYGNLTLDLDDLKNCKSVYEVVPVFEEKLCKSSIDWLLTTVKLHVWLIIALTALGVAIGRVEILIWRKNKEIESMMEKMEAVY